MQSQFDAQADKGAMGRALARSAIFPVPIAASAARRLRARAIATPFPLDHPCVEICLRLGFCSAGHLPLSVSRVFHCLDTSTLLPIFSPSHTASLIPLQATFLDTIKPIPDARLEQLQQALNDARLQGAA
ncbi:hypothetical protein WJ87_06860 [Burkholderia ubonensis]|nr:hypothetical protein WJ87_06860 [Burkholderia ubonensis]